MTDNNQDARASETNPADEGSPAAEPTVLRLDHFLKMRNLTETGGQAKLLIQDGKVRVNGVVDTRRRRKLVPGDVVEVNGRRLVVK